MGFGFKLELLWLWGFLLNKSLNFFICSAALNIGVLLYIYLNISLALDAQNMHYQTL